MKSNVKNETVKSNENPQTDSSKYSTPTLLTGIFLDTGKIADIEKYLELGIVRGVTTNPTILVKDGVTGGWAGIEQHFKKIARLIDPLPLSIEVTSNDYNESLKQAQQFAGWADNVNVKITIHGPEGGTDNLKLIHELENRHNIRVNATAMMSAQQCLLAAFAKATYVSIFGGRVNNMGYDSRLEVKRLRTLLDSFGLKSKIIVGSTREVLNIIEWFEAGADIVTAVPSLIEGMLVHPYSKETVKMFLDDGAKLQKLS